MCKRTIKIVEGALLEMSMLSILSIEDKLIGIPYTFQTRTLADRAYRYPRAEWFDYRMDDATWIKLIIARETFRYV